MNYRKSWNQQIAIAYTNGSCLINGQSEPRAGIGICWLNMTLPIVSMRLNGDQTSQRAELVAALLAIEIAKQNGYNRLIIRTDSAYVVNSQTIYIYKWLRNNFNGGQVKNKQDFLDIINASEGMEVLYEKVNAQSGGKCNFEANRSAKEGANINLP